MPTTHQKNLCFCTLALGLEYASAALLLVKDLAKYSPDTRIVVLTDLTELFDNECNVDVVPFRSVSPVGCYHDKRYCISEALRRATYCCYVDADCRIRQAPPPNFFEGSDEGIIAWNVVDFLPRFANEKAGELVRGAPRLNNCDRRLSLSKSVASRLGVDLGKAKFLSEVCMCFSRKAPNLLRFLELWDKYAHYLQVRGYGWGEGETIGIVAQHVGWRVKGVDPTSWLFKDVLTPATMTDPLTLQLRDERVILAELKAGERGKLRKLFTFLATCGRFFIRTNDRFLLRA